MKYIVVLSAVLLAASALPVDIDTETNGDVAPYNYHPVDEIANSSARFHTGLIGFGAATVGGVGGAVWNVFDAFALRSALDNTERRIVRVNGRIDLTVLFERSPGVILRVGPYKTIQGTNRNAEIFGGGFTVNNQVHVIFSNLKITNALSYAPGETPNGQGGIANQQPGPWSLVDGIDIGQSEFIWVDHCEFSDDPFNAASVPEERRRHDGQIDIRYRSSWISISNTIFRNHNMVTLVGNGDALQAQDTGKLKVTFYYNWYRGVNQRCPLARYGEVHMLNNLFSDITFYAIGVGVGVSIYAERNVFVNTRRAWVSAWSAPWPIGHLFPLNNWFTNSHQQSDTVSGHVSFHPNDYYRYTPQAAASVEAYVRANAGPR